MIRFSLVVLVTVLVLIFGLANMHVVELYTVFGGAVRASMAFLLIGAFGIGFVVASLFGLHRSVVQRSDGRRATPPVPPRPALPPPPPMFARESRTWEP